MEREVVQQILISKHHLRPTPYLQNLLLILSLHPKQPQRRTQLHPRKISCHLQQHLCLQWMDRKAVKPLRMSKHHLQPTPYLQNLLLILSLHPKQPQRRAQLHLRKISSHLQQLLYLQRMGGKAAKPLRMSKHHLQPSPYPQKILLILSLHPKQPQRRTQLHLKKISSYLQQLLHLQWMGRKAVKPLRMSKDHFQLSPCL